jgi:hypothetical protein
MKSYQINVKKCLIIPDVHQDVEWVMSILEKEKGNYDHIIFTGDYFDTHKSTEQVSGKETARFVKGLCDGIFGPVTICVGNHDIGYMESWSANQKFTHKHHILNSCSGFTNSKSIEINKILKWEDWRKFQLFTEFGGYLFSHAGMHPSFWNFYKTREENLDSLWEEADDALRSVSIKPSRLFVAGQSRGGPAPVGGLIWQDIDEFEDNEEMPPQIFGHTVGNNPRRKGRSYCLDSGQKTYGLLDKVGNLRIKSIHGDGSAQIEEWSGWRYNGWVT